MSLNRLQLTNQLLTALYPDVLVESKTTRPSPDPAPIKYLGNNGRNIVLLVNHASVAYLSDGELSFLTNILSACQLSLADVAVVNVHTKGETDIESFLQPLAHKSVLLFGIPPLQASLPINFPQFQLQAFNKCTYLYSPNLAELESDKALKIKLWGCLKTLFDL